MNKNTYCGNCGKYGHVYRKCLSPIISSGIILVKKDFDQLKYLLVQRKDTLGFVEFMRGKYNLENIQYLNKIFQIMTLDERLNIINRNKSFDDLWAQLWMKKETKQYHTEYEVSKKKFNSLKKGIFYNNIFISLETIHNNNLVKWVEPEWGFPKGRRNKKETNLECATREFEEETGITRDKFTILHQIDPIEELFSGTNNIRYKHIYYVAAANNLVKNKFTVDKNNFNQVTEISTIKWHTFENGLDVIRDYNIEKKNVLEKVNKILIN